MSPQLLKPVPSFPKPSAQGAILWDISYSSRNSSTAMRPSDEPECLSDSFTALQSVAPLSHPISLVFLLTHFTDKENKAPPGKATHSCIRLASPSPACLDSRRPEPAGHAAHCYCLLHEAFSNFPNFEQIICAKGPDLVPLSPVQPAHSFPASLAGRLVMELGSS